MIWYYQMVGYEVTMANLQGNMVMENFEIQWKDFQEQKEEDPPEFPKITKALPIMKWSEDFQDHLMICIWH